MDLPITMVESPANIQNITYLNDPGPVTTPPTTTPITPLTPPVTLPVQPLIVSKEFTITSIDTDTTVILSQQLGPSQWSNLNIGGLLQSSTSYTVVTTTDPTTTLTTTTLTIPSAMVWVGAFCKFQYMTF